MIWLSICLYITASFAFGAEVSITMDDFNLRENTVLTATERNKKILTAFKKNKAKAVLFVVGQNIQSRQDRMLLREWSDSGHIIGNHTFSHKLFSRNVTVEWEQQDILDCEKVIKNEPGFEKLFRFPMLAEGNTRKKRDTMRVWLESRGYKNGSVTIDISDWYIDQRLRKKLKTDPKADLVPYRNYYLAHVWDRAQYYNNLSKKVLGREIKHTLLVHFNLLNALFLDDILLMFKSKGWSIIDAKEAFQDPAFSRLPDSMPSGQSLIWGFAKETGDYEQELRYPGEDSTYEKPAMDELGL